MATRARDKQGRFIKTLPVADHFLEDRPELPWLERFELFVRLLNWRTIGWITLVVILAYLGYHIGFTGRLF